MLVYRTIAENVFWEFDSIIMQNLNDILPLFCTPTWLPHHVSENQECMVNILYIVVSAFIANLWHMLQEDNTLVSLLTFPSLKVILIIIDTLKTLGDSPQPITKTCSTAVPGTALRVEPFAG